MKLSNIANVFDVEHDDGRLIEIGLTTVSLKDRQILQSHSIAIKPDFELTAEISRLTGWTQAKLLKRGISKEEASRRLDGYGSNNRLLVTDHSDEIPFLEAALGRTLSPHRLNVSVMVALFTGNDFATNVRGIQLNGSGVVTGLNAERTSQAEAAANLLNTAATSGAPLFDEIHGRK
jgi:hypothetical protein